MKCHERDPKLDIAKAQVKATPEVAIQPRVVESLALPAVASKKIAIFRNKSAPMLEVNV